MRTRVILGVAIAAIVLGGALLFIPHFIGGSGTPSAASGSAPAGAAHAPSPTPTVPPAALRIPTGGVSSVKTPSGLTWISWELIDRDSGKVLGASTNATSKKNNIESMIKTWIAADYLSHLAKAGKKLTSTDAKNLKTMIVRSDDTQATHFYNLNGHAASISRMDSVCHLGSTPIGSKAYPWSTVQITASQSAHLAQCIASGTAAGTFTDDLLGWMTDVTGSVTDQPDPPYGPAGWGGGRWGIIDGVPASLVSKTSIKNGWEPENYQHRWNINCMAILPHQVLAVELQYPWTTSNGSGRYQDADNLQRGAAGCQSIAKQLSNTTK